MKEQYLDFDEYIQQREPDELERHDAWRVAISIYLAMLLIVNN